MQDKATRELKASTVGSSVKPPGIVHHPLPLLDGHGHRLRKIMVQYECLSISDFSSWTVHERNLAACQCSKDDGQKGSR